MRNESIPIKPEAVEARSNFQSVKIGPFQIISLDSPMKPTFVPTKSEWTNLELAKYAAFILHNRSSIQNRPCNKLWGLYSEMSMFLGSRNFRQCKSHHARMSNLTDSVLQIIEFYQANV